MNNNRRNNNFTHNVLFYAVIFLCIMGIAYFFFGGSQNNGQSKTVSQTEFISELKSNKVKSFQLQPNGGVYKITGTYRKPQSVDNNSANSFGFATQRNSKVNHFQSSVLQSDVTVSQLQKYANRDNVKISTRAEESNSVWMNLLLTVLPLIIMIFFFYMMMGQAGQGGGGRGVMSFGKTKAKPADAKKNKVRFSDVAGEEEEKQELVEVVEFLKNPKKFTRLGAKIPSGVLLEGPPGTGKTLLAKAVAGESGVPFFSISGSDFVEMFVGVGASRVRDLFRQAKEKAPCIIFIDEIDAVGRARGKNPNMGGNDERENTLNQLLTEMDGFGSNSGVIILAATNRVDILDKALLRAGRFDRQIYVDLPDLNERKEVFGVHLKPLKLDKNVDVDLLARQTPGFSGADIANVCNEAALIAARHSKASVDKDDFLAAIDRIVGGLEKKTKVMTAAEKRTIALHEAGHATISWFLEHANPLIKVTIVPRGRALGAAWYLPEERQISTKEQMLDEMCATLGGRAAEDVFVGHISTGAMNDLERVTKQAYGMIAYAGMSDKLPNLCYYSNDEYSFSKPYSEHTAELIDQEVQNMINEQYARAKALLLEHKEGHNQLAQLLIEKEVIFAEDVEKIFGKRPWTSRSEEIMASEEASKQKEEKQEKEETPVSTSENEAKDPEVKELPEPTEDKTTLNN